MERYNKIKPIGSGTFGQAWLVESTISQRKYALKELGVTAMSEQDRHLALNEAKILAKLKHKNIVRYKEAFVAQGKLCIAMEFAEKGDLYTRIRGRNGSHFPETQILEWFTQLCLALKYIHGQNILHRDLKTQNIFLGKDDVIKLGDFGIARMLNNTLDHAQTTVGTPYYLSPEICQRKPYNHKSDMWSLGCVLYEMATLKHAFHANNFSALVLKILQGQYPPVPSCYGPLVEDLISVLLQKNPDERPSAKQLLYVPAMQPYVKRFLMSERDRTDSIASEISDISSRSEYDFSQMTEADRKESANDDMKTATDAADSSISSKQTIQVKQNTSRSERVAGEYSRDLRISSNDVLKPREDIHVSENTPKAERDLPASDNAPELQRNVGKTDNVPNTRENLPASGNASQRREHVYASENALKEARKNFTVSGNILKERENLRARYSVGIRKQSLRAIAHAQQRRYSEQNPACSKPGSRIHKTRIQSQGGQCRELADSEDDVFAKNQETVIPVRRTVITNNVTNRRKFDQNVAYASSSCRNKLTSLAEQRIRKPASSVCQPQCTEDMRERKRHQSALSVCQLKCTEDMRERKRHRSALSVCQPKCTEDMREIKRHQLAITAVNGNLYRTGQKQRRLTSRPEDNSQDKENKSSSNAHAQMTAKRRVSSDALKQIQVPNLEKQQTVKPGSRATGNGGEIRKRTYTVSRERRMSEFEIPEVDGIEYDNGKSGSLKRGNGICKGSNAIRVTQRESNSVGNKNAKDEKPPIKESDKPINSNLRKCENIVQFSSKTSDSERASSAHAQTPCCKFTFCGKTLHLDNVSAHDSVYSHMEALRMHLEKKLGTRLLTAVYRYVTNSSLEENERVKETVLCMLGKDNMAYFSVLLQLLACEEAYFH